MPRIEVGEGKLTGPNGEDVPVKVINAESIDGLTTQIVLPESMAKEVAAALEGRKIAVAKPGDVPPEPPKKGKKDG